MNFRKVHEDERGEIHVIEGVLPGDREITLLTTKPGYARGGCVHDCNPEFFTVLSGQVRYNIQEEEEQIVGVGEMIKIPAGKPHYFEALVETVAIEWGPTVEEKKEYDSVFRQLVEEINRRTSNGL